jgi:hypothetical protein
MTTIITAPDPLPAGGFKIYLAGAIDMGQAIDWQAQVIDALAGMPGLVLINPRRAQFTPDMETEQIQWELEALERADVILMWFPAGSKAPISFFEAGLYLRSGKLLIGAEAGFYRRCNLELTCERYGVRLVDDLRLLISQCQRRGSGSG